MLADEFATAHLSTEHDATCVSGAISAVLSLVACRLRDVARAVEGDIDPAMLWDAHNDATAAPPDEHHDIILYEHVGDKKRP